MFLGMGMWGWAMIAAFVVGGLITVIGSAISPAKFDFAVLKAKGAGAKS
jgi:hypothetical protein